MVWTLTDCVDSSVQNKCPTVSRVRLTTLLDGRVAGTTQPRCNHGCTQRAHGTSLVVPEVL